ncbi:bacteriohemerythrin [Thalassolituus sp. LLYu03]|uniref:bacteriohemerythrin n=1 Tax=Thalassolituus sp. LLYu03 TaxID=3421656 RepID=UPI003D2922DC
MDKFEWTPDLNLGIDVIDSQHRRIVDYINDLSVAISQESVDQVFDVMERLRDYTLDHFAFEEQLMEQAGYPLQKSHQLVHRRFEDKVANMVEELTNGRDPFGIARRARNSLMVWLIQHIRHEDQDYVAVVKKVVLKEQGWISGALKRIFGSADHPV